MNWNENKSEYPPEEKTPDGIGKRKSVRVIIFTLGSDVKDYKSPNPQTVFNVAYYDYLKSKWFIAHNFDQWKMMPKLQVIAWCEINNIPVSKPADNQTVKFTDCQNITRIGTYVESEDLFLINDMDFIFRQFVVGWTPIIKPLNNENS